MLLPRRQLAVANETAGRQRFFADLPLSELVPVKHRHGLVRFRSCNGLRAFPIQDAHSQLRGFPTDLLERHHRPANDPVSDKGVVAAVDRDATNGSELVQRLPRGKRLAGGILEYHEIKDDRIIGEARYLAAQFLDRKIGQPTKVYPTFKRWYLFAERFRK